MAKEVTPTPAPVPTPTPEAVHTLSAIEIAALTARVPCTGNKDLDAIITQGLRVSMATEIMASAVAYAGWGLPREVVAKEAVAYADALLDVFSNRPKAKE